MAGQETGYVDSQMEAVQFAMENGVDIQPYLQPEYRSACLKEIVIGLMKGLDVSIYANHNYTWRKMREIRLGLEQHLDVSRYLDPLYSYWQMREIRLGLKDGLDVSDYDSFMYTAKEMRNRRLKLKKRKKLFEVSKDWTVLSSEDYDLCISPDGLKAYLTWHKTNAVESVNALEGILKGNGIVYGIDYKALEYIAREYREITDKTKSDSSILVATGLAPKDGTNGFYEWKVHATKSRNPKLKEDGSIDFEKMKWFQFVKKGDTLAIYHFAEMAVDGIDIFGKKIPAKIGKEKEMLKGRGFELKSDLRTYVASSDGHVIFRENELLVEDMLILPQYDYTQGTLHYEGDVYIGGTIEGPVTIEVDGDLVVEGFVKNAQIRCGGNLILKRGINNATGLMALHVGGCVISHFFEYVTVYAGGNIHFGASLNSNLSSYGAIVSYGEKSGIIGGNSYAEKGFCLTNIGNNAGIITTLNLGSNGDIHALRMVAEKKEKELRNVVKQLTIVQNQMHVQLLNENQNAEEMFSRVRQTLEEKETELMSVRQDINNIKKRENRANRSRIVVDQYVYENVRIHYLNESKVVIPAKQLVIKIHDEKIVVEKINHMFGQTA